MREPATLVLADGKEVAVEVDTSQLDRPEIIATRVAAEPLGRSVASFLRTLDAHLARATPHPAGTADRLLEADRDRPY